MSLRDYLREQGVAANATERSVRSETRIPKKDGIYRAQQRGTSTHLHHRVETIARELVKGKVQPGKGKSRLLSTRKELLQGWSAVQDMLTRNGNAKMANQVGIFVANLKPPHTEQEQIALELLRLRGGKSTRVR